MARATKINVDIVDAAEMTAAVDRHFNDLINNIPDLRSTENHNIVSSAREALKAALIKKTATQTKQEA